MLYFALLQLLYLPELHLALQVPASKSKGRFSTLYNAPIQKMKAKINSVEAGDFLQPDMALYLALGLHSYSCALVPLGPSFLNSLNA